jgi:hypothetical protein
MQCPACGSDGIDEDVVFCPHCRYQFRVPDDDVVFETRPYPGSRRMVYGGPADQKFSNKELQLAKLQLVQPVVLIAIAVAGALYLSSPRIGQVSVTVAGMDIFFGGVLCLVLGALAAMIVYLAAAHRLGRT